MKLVIFLSYIGFILVSCTAPKNQKKEVLVWPPPFGFDSVFIKDSLKHLMPILDSVYFHDQVYRRYKDIDSGRKYRNEINRLDSLNLIKITPIIEKYGILGLKEVGHFGYSAITLTIQHADLSTQEKYLPLFRAALKNKKIIPDTYALLEDRVAKRNGKMQIYGSQLMKYSNTRFELWPPIDIDNIDKRRDSIGMKETIEVYVQRFDKNWTLEKYKKELPALIKKYKLQ